MVFSLTQAHAMVMILSYMTFGSTGILFARYGRSLRLGNRRQLLGKAVWFQIHRFLLSLTAILTLLGFLLILVRAGGDWVKPQTPDLRLFFHSVLGGIIVCCSIIQIWLALYRCNPHSRFRFIFVWSHRIIGFLAFGLSIPTIFLIIVLLSKFIPNLIPIFTSWTIWMVIIVILFERLEYQQRAPALPTITNNVQGGDTNQANMNTNLRPDTEAGTNINVGSRRYNYIKLLLLFIHFIISITLSISLIIFLSM